jgi:hypothetical protein
MREGLRPTRHCWVPCDPSPSCSRMRSPSPSAHRSPPTSPSSSSAPFGLSLSRLQSGVMSSHYHLLLSRLPLSPSTTFNPNLETSPLSSLLPVLIHRRHNNNPIVTSRHPPLDSVTKILHCPLSPADIRLTRRVIIQSVQLSSTYTVSANHFLWGPRFHGTQVAHKTEKRKQK